MEAETERRNLLIVELFDYGVRASIGIYIYIYI